VVHFKGGVDVACAIANHDGSSLLGRQMAVQKDVDLDCGRKLAMACGARSIVIVYGLGAPPGLGEGLKKDPNDRAIYLNEVDNVKAVFQRFGRVTWLQGRSASDSLNAGWVQYESDGDALRALTALSNAKETVLGQQLYVSADRNTEVLPLPLPTEPHPLTVVLDLDETLISGRQERPGVQDIIGIRDVELIAWTKSWTSLGNSRVLRLDGGRRFVHVISDGTFGSDRKTFLKDLSSIGRDLQRTILIDDKFCAMIPDPRRALIVAPFRAKCPDAFPVLSEVSRVIQSLAIAEGDVADLLQRDVCVVRVDMIERRQIDSGEPWNKSVRLMTAASLSQMVYTGDWPSAF